MILIDKLFPYENIDTIFFDIDGTITRWIDVKAFLKKSLSILGVPYSDEALTGLFDAMEARELHALITSEADEDIYSKFLGMYIESLAIYGVTGWDLKNVMFELEASETFISEEVQREMKWLAEHYNLYAYTNWFQKQAIKKLDRYDLTKYFKNIHSSENSYIKDTKVSFLSLIYKYKLDPTRTVHIGDSECDVIPSKNAGMRSIYLNYNLTKADGNVDREKLNEKIMRLINTTDASITEFNDIRRVLTKVD